MMLKLQNICKTYDQDNLEVPVLKDISLSVEEGEYLAIMGPSGSGKTTLMNIIGCLDVPSEGEYYLEGEELSSKTDAQLSQVRLKSIGFVFQSFHLLPRQSALENVALPLLYAGVKKAERLEIARAALERVGLGERVNFKPTQLSGGQCQRVAIARAMVNNPKILLADEPTGALDTASGEQIMELFQKLNEQGVTIVMITHESEIAAHAKRVLHIRDGALVDEPLPAVVSKPTPPPAVPQETLVFSTREFKAFRAQREHPIEIESIDPLIEPKPVERVEVELPKAKKAEPVKIEIENIVPEVKKAEPKPVERVEVELPKAKKAEPVKIEIENIVPEVKKVEPKPVERVEVELPKMKKAEPVKIEIENIVPEVKKVEPKPVQRVEVELPKAKKAEPVKIEIENIVPEVKKAEPKPVQRVEVELPKAKKAGPVKIEIENIVPEVKKAEPVKIEIENIVPEVKKVEPKPVQRVEVELPKAKKAEPVKIEIENIVPEVKRTAKPIEIESIVPQIQRVERKQTVAQPKREEQRHVTAVEISAEQLMRPSVQEKSTKSETQTELPRKPGTKKLIDIEAILPIDKPRK